MENKISVFCFFTFDLPFLLLFRLRLHELGFISIQFHDFETASKSMRFGSVYTKPFSPGNQSRDGIREHCTTC